MNGMQSVWRGKTKNFLFCHQRLFPFSSTLASTSVRYASSSLRIGGRQSPLGFSRSLGKAPQVKQGKPMGVVKRIPGTTKIEYTNKKGRSFTFRIPITELTHPPVLHPSFSSGNDKEIDTSFCDTGELDECMPSPVENYLRQRARKQYSSVLSRPEDGARGVSNSEKVEDDDALLVALNLEEIKEVGKLFKDFCKNYVFLDTRGMKGSMSYNELNTGPDYEHYDRKLMRKRYWLSIRQTYDLVAEIIWPSDLLIPKESGREKMNDKKAEGQESHEFVCPSNLNENMATVSAEEMLDILVWLEAASTFCVRSWRAYDYYDKKCFLPLNLSREVQVLGARVKESHSDFFHFFQRKEEKSEKVLPSSLHYSDRLIECIGLCEAHDVSLSCFFPSSLSSQIKLPVLTATPSPLLFTPSAAKHSLLAHILSQLPASPFQLTPKDTIRVLHGICRTCTMTEEYVFSSQHGESIQSTVLFRGITKLCAVFANSGLQSVENVDEDDLCVMLQFILHVKEGNSALLRLNVVEEKKKRELKKNSSWNREGFGSMEKYPNADVLHLSDFEECPKIILRFEELCLARCRYLLYRLGGPQTVVLSGDNPYIPLVDFQNHKEKSSTNHSGGSSASQSLLHYRIGRQHAQGLRRVSLQSKAVELLTLLSRLHSLNERGVSGMTKSSSAPSVSGNDEEVEMRVTELAGDIVQHIALRVTSSGQNLTLPEIVRLLPILSFVTHRERKEIILQNGKWEPERVGSEGGRANRYHRLFQSISASIGLEMQNEWGSSSSPHAVAMIVALVDGLARCHFIPSTLFSVEMVLTRHCLHGHLSVFEVKNALLRLLALKGTSGLPAAMLHAAGSFITERLDSDNLALFQGSRRPFSLSSSTSASALSGEYENQRKELLDLLRVLCYCEYPSVIGLILRIADVHLSTCKEEETDLSTRSALGVLFSFVSASPSLEEETKSKFFDLSLRELRAGVDALPHLNDSDLVIDTLLSFAALGEPIPESSFYSFLGQFTALHSVLSPVHAAHVLEALEMLKLHHIAGPLYSRYTAWLLDYFQPSLSQIKMNNLDSAPFSRFTSPTVTSVLSPSDRSTLIQLSHLQYQTADLTDAVNTLLRHELFYLEKERESCNEQKTSSSTCSFESIHLRRNEDLRKVDKDIMEVCTALYHKNGNKLSL